ncbi:MAG: TIGR04222 domain-containing membrane protein, partial [Planctomycetales bacterium]|nr:TIGR04222 domain-containing membrane protein [Planctomycetales bacterium]
MTLDDVELWQRIERFAFDERGDSLPFTSRLAREHGWGLRRAHRVLVEYRRFLYLAATSASPVCPSQDVDEAWHLHLAYTRSYWERLCRDTLGRSLHHHPTAGGSEQLAYHRAMYESTLQRYRDAFDADPPRDIWPPVDERFASNQHMRVVNLADHWLVRKPRWKQRRRRVRRTLRRKGLTGASLAIAIGPLIGAGMNPLDLRGPQFLGLYLVTIAASLGIAAILRMALRERPIGGANIELDDVDPYDAALLAGGERHAVQLAVVDLIMAGELALEREPTLALRIAKPLDGDRHPIVRHVYESVAARGALTLVDAYAAAASAVIVWSMGITQHRSSVDGVRALVNLALARGNVGRDG